MKKFITMTMAALLTGCATNDFSNPKNQPGNGGYLTYGSNMLTDPSFENVSNPEVGKFVDASMARSGSSALRMSLLNEQILKKENRVATLDPVAVEPEQLYKLEVWVHIPEIITTPDRKRSAFLKPDKMSMFGAFLRGDLLDVNGTRCGEALVGKNQLDLAHATYGSWIQLRGLVKTNKDTKSLQLSCGLEEDEGTVFFDDLSLRKIDNPNDFLRMFESPEARDERIGWWKESGYGMFPIFGIYSIHGGVWKGRYEPNKYAEWMTFRQQVPHGELKALAEVFRPDAFDADEYVRLAKEAGMGHIVITAKYHDGFAMWDTQCDKFNIKDCSGFDRDILMELKDACRKAGLHYGFYYSQSQEWYTPGGFSRDHYAFGDYPEDIKGKARLYEMDIAPFDLPRNYLENKSKPQLLELMEKYDPEVIWFDVPTEINIIDALELLAIIRKNNPHCLAGSRLHQSEELRDFLTMGDYKIPEGEIAETYWESLPGMQKHTYSYDQFQPFRSPEEIFKELKEVRRKGGNFLLAIGGPRGDGSIPEINFEILRKVKALADKEGL
ncbi:hypothetical protein PDESU_00895 [Pontiella desulfatans]|uniref:alpha-L-fucosidase n=1 Tax=Pontiella desulfatans TaxID=2750659 RepID=A0A6C2TXL2_PONDE|nr:alpha-L-fucosidase [Pontiella desulfatans]VGO12343.1 hypothetical protein PDESU_00895 [Pontiella desulfatans]